MGETEKHKHNRDTPNMQTSRIHKNTKSETTIDKQNTRLEKFQNTLRHIFKSTFK